MFSYSSQFYPDALFSHTKSTLLNVLFIILWSLIHLQVRSAEFSAELRFTPVWRKKKIEVVLCLSEIPEDVFPEIDSTECQASATNPACYVQFMINFSFINWI